MTDASPFDSRYSWTRLAVTLLVATVGNVGMWSIIVVMPDMQAEFGIDRAGASLPYTMTMIGFALGNALVGRIVDARGISQALILSAILIAAGKVIGAMTGSIMGLSVMQLVIGLGTATSFGPLIADISHWFRRRRGIAVAIAASGNYLSGAIWPVLLSGVMASFGWRGVYLSLAGIVLLVVVPMAIILGRQQMSAETKSSGAGAGGDSTMSLGLSANQLTVLLGIAGIGCCVAMSMPQVHIVSLCVDLGFGPAVGAEMLSLMLLGGVMSRLVFGLLSDRLGGIRTILIGSTLQCLALFLYLPFDGMVSLYVVSLIFGLAQGGIVPAYAIVVREYLPAHQAASRVGIVMMLTVVGMALGGWMSGWIYDVTGDYQMAFLNGIAWNVLNMGILAMLLWRSGRLRPAFE